MKAYSVMANDSGMDEDVFILRTFRDGLAAMDYLDKAKAFLKRREEIEDAWMQTGYQEALQSDVPFARATAWFNLQEDIEKVKPEYDMPLHKTFSKVWMLESELL